MSGVCGGAHVLAHGAAAATVVANEETWRSTSKRSGDQYQNISTSWQNQSKPATLFCAILWRRHHNQATAANQAARRIASGSNDIMPLYSPASVSIFSLWRNRKAAAGVAYAAAYVA